MGDKVERSFIMVKPDGVHRGVVGEIVKRFEQRGYRLVAMKFVWVRDNVIVVTMTCHSSTKNSSQKSFLKLSRWVDHIIWTLLCNCAKNVD